MFIVLGRDHGLPTFLDTRRKCGFNANFKTFDDMIAIFPQNYVDLLKLAYSSVEDIDLYVGGSLESFLTIESVFVGETFGCVIGEQYRRVMGGDSYFYSNLNSPYPFTPAQLEAIKNVGFNNLICVNSGLSLIQKVWFLVDNKSYNTKVPCTLLKQIDLSAWEDV
jgi:peroxidase